MSVREWLEERKDVTFRDFNAKLIPNLEKSVFVGVKTPELKAFAKEFYRRGDYGGFLRALPHGTFEENQIHGFLLGQMTDFETAMAELERFLPFVDNWATCDQLILKCIAKDPERVLCRVDLWLSSPHPYTVRFGMGILMRYFLDTRFLPEYLEKVANVSSEEYYINMMRAWYFATALAKQYEAVLPYFTARRLPLWVHNKALQKARESFRIPTEHKDFLKTLSVKKEDDRGF